MKQLLGGWWSGAGPDADMWQFNMKANAGDKVGQSFAVHVRNDAGRDALLERFLADAGAQQPNCIFDGVGHAFVGDMASIAAGEAWALFLQWLDETVG